MRKEYASQLTKEELIKAGVTAVDLNNCKVYGEQSEFIPTINSQGYLMISLYDLDDNGNKIRVPIKRQFKGCKKPTNTYTYKSRMVSLNRLIWAWQYGIVPSGYIIDHIDNKHENIEDYRLDNLQCITPAENIAKERPESNYMVRPAKGKTIEFYSNKLNKYLTEYEIAKKNHDADKVHKIRANISQNRAKIRYIKTHGYEF